MKIIEHIVKEEKGSAITDMFSILDERITDKNESKIVKTGLKILIHQKLLLGFAFGLIVAALMMLLLIRA